MSYLIEFPYAGLYGVHVVRTQLGARGRLKEPITLSPRTWEGKRLPFNGVMNPQQLATLTATLNNFCKTAAIEPDTPEFDEARYLVMSLYRSGATTAEALAAAVENRLLRDMETPPAPWERLETIFQTSSLNDR